MRERESCELFSEFQTVISSHRDMLNPLDSDGVRTKTEEWNLVVDRL